MSCNSLVVLVCPEIRFSIDFLAISLTLYRQIELSDHILKNICMKNISCSCNLTDLRNIERHSKFILYISVIKVLSFITAYVLQISK